MATNTQVESQAVPGRPGAPKLAARPAAPKQRRSIRSLFRAHSYAFALMLAILFLVVNLSIQPNFGWTDQLASFAPLAIAAVASVPSIISGRGGLDMSISPIMTLSSILFGVWLVPLGLGGAVSVPVLMLVGAAVGTLSGLLIVVLRLQPIVVTLSMFFIITGVNLKLAPLPVSISGTWLENLGGSWGPIPGGLVSILIPVAIWLALTRTPYRRMLYAVGGNDITAFSAGLNVNAIRVSAYALGGSFAAVGGLALTGLVSSAVASTSTSYTLIAIAAVALGGTSLAGGRGGILGALIGAAAIYMLQSMLGVLQVSQIWLQIIYGLLLLVAVVFSAVLAVSPKEKK